MTFSELPIFDQIMSDGKIPPRQLQLWRELTKHLDVVRTRKLPRAKLEERLDLDASNLTKLITALIDRGYLLREENLYRIPLSRENMRDLHENAENISDVTDDSSRGADTQLVVLPRRARRAPIRSDDIV